MNNIVLNESRSNYNLLRKYYNFNKHFNTKYQIRSVKSYAMLVIGIGIMVYHKYVKR